MISGIVQRIRCNHALEHATIHVLTQRYPNARAAGLSNADGFSLYTNLSAEEVVPAVMEALALLKAGRRELAVHPNCGTNLVTTAGLTTLVGFLSFGLTYRPIRRRLEQIPETILLSIIALIAAKPLGDLIQKHLTTNADVQNLEVTSIFTGKSGPFRDIRINTHRA